MRILPVALGLMLLAAVPAAAQSDSITVTPMEPEGPVPPGGSLTLYADVAVDCLLIIQNAGSLEVSFAFPDAPTGVNASVEPVSYDAQGCLTSPAPLDGTLIKNITVDVSASEDAPGLTPFALTMEATGDDQTGSGDFQGLMVDYSPGHTIDPGNGETFEVRGGQVSFNLTIDVTANARTMVMFEDKDVPAGAKLDGLSAVTFEVAAGERTATLPVTFQAPQGDWEELEVSFTNFSHCLDGSPCDPVQQQQVTWTFVNMGGAPTGTDGDGGDEGEESPGAGMLLVALGVLAAALVAARRR